MNVFKILYLSFLTLMLSYSKRSFINVVSLSVLSGYFLGHMLCHYFERDNDEIDIDK